MPSYLMLIEYDGTKFSGWLKQPGQRTIQDEIEKAAAKLLGKRPDITAAGRTDKGVHAMGQAASFKTRSNINLPKFCYSINAILPKDISVTNVKKTEDGFNARFMAKEKTYSYCIWNKPLRSVWLGRYACNFHAPLSVVKMRIAAKKLLGEHDFSSFDASGSAQPNKKANLMKIEIKRKGDEVKMKFTADRFLYKMVRNIAGTLIDAGRGKTSAQKVKEILEKRNRVFAGKTAPAKGLFLEKVVF